MSDRPPITAEQVRGWLKDCAPNASKLARVREERLGWFSNEVLRLGLEWEGAPGPASLIVKRRIPDRSPASETFADEARILREVAAPAPVDAPRVFHASEDILVMEELPGLVPFDFRAGASDRHAEAALAALGRFHTHGIDRDLPGWLPSFADPAQARGLGERFDRAWNAHRDGIEDVVPDRFPALADAWLGRLPSLLGSFADGTTILHGDAHGENLPERAAGGVAFLDWAAAHAGPPAFDLAVFVGMSFPTGRRRAHERAWVRTHAASWDAAGGDAFEDPWRSYVRGLLMRALHLVSQVAGQAWIRNPGLALVLSRCAQAALDHADEVDLG